MNEDEVIQRLKTARRELDNLYPVVQMIDDWQFDRENKLWYYHMLITIKTENRYFPIASQWYVVVESIYPQGKVKIYPDIENSITTTLYHQSNNYSINKNGYGEMVHYVLMSIPCLLLIQSHFLLMVGCCFMYRELLNGYILLLMTV
mgnify:CR=1 FL=1